MQENCPKNIVLRKIETILGKKEIESLKKQIDTKGILERSRKLHQILIIEGFAVGIVAGLVTILYRLALTYADEVLQMVLSFSKNHVWAMVGWFGALLLLAVLCGKLVDWEPMASGSGIPQLEGEMAGQIKQTWWKVILAKFIGGIAGMLGGLSLGREGPSIQLGAMAGKGFSRILGRSRTEEKFLLTCGASAGLAAAFNAPLAGVMFSLEEIHKNFSVTVLVSVMTASITADFLSKNVFGLKPVFQFQVADALPLRYYWLLLVLGVLLGVLGAFYNWFTLKVQALYQKPKRLGNCTRMMIPFLLAGVLGFTVPQLLGSGHHMVTLLTDGSLVLPAIILLLIGKFLFSAISFGSGAPGGIFFPLLVLGCYIGGAFGQAAVQFVGVDPVFVHNFIILAMAGYFTAIVRAPITGIILIFEMTGSFSQMLSLSVVSIVAYIIANLLRSHPIYESLLENILKRQGKVAETPAGEKMIYEYVVHHGAWLESKRVGDVDWPKNCLLVAIKRGETELIPKGQTRIRAGDIIVTLTDEAELAKVCRKMEQICGEG